MSTEPLRKVFRTLSDPTRVRILALLEHEELAVGELMEVLGMAQSRVSRHLGILREAGWVDDRREGTFVFYRFRPPSDSPAREAWQLVAQQLRDDPTSERDRAALARAIEARASRSRAFFEAVGPEWDALRKVFQDQELRARAVAHLAPPGLRVADVGTGTGVLALELARLGHRVVAIDHSRRMLEAARSKLEQAGLGEVELRLGEAGALPLEDAEVDAAFAHMVLHYLPSPSDAIREMVRVVRPGGAVVVADFVPHESEWMREELGVLWLGFDPGEVRGWFDDAGLVSPRLETFPSAAPSRELPGSFIASARRP